MSRSRIKSRFTLDKKKSTVLSGRSMHSFKKYKKERTGPEFDYTRLEENLNCINEDWIQFISICIPCEEKHEDKNFVANIFKKVGLSKSSGEAGVVIAENNELSSIMEVYGMPDYVKFPYFFFDFKRFVIEEKKSVLVMKEIQLLNLISSVVCGLSVCEQMRLPHGNLSRSTIFKNGKHSWSISPPLYSRVNLKRRMVSLDNRMKITANCETAIDYLLAPEIQKKIKAIRECNFTF